MEFPMIVPLKCFPTFEYKIIPDGSDTFKVSIEYGVTHAGLSMSTVIAEFPLILTIELECGIKFVLKTKEGSLNQLFTL